jgi:hypothetical protein
MPALLQPFNPADWSLCDGGAAIPPLPTGATSASLIAMLGTRIKGLTLWATQAGYQASVSIDVKNAWNIAQNSDPEEALKSCLWGSSWYRL